MEKEKKELTVTKEFELGGRKLKAVIGKMAKQADGASWIQYGDTVLHTAVVSSHETRDGLDFLPLTVDFREKAFAAGRIPGGFFKREGRPHESEILNSRIIDRPIRPLFPDGYACETQVMSVVLSADLENDAAVLGPIGASLALNLSDIPMVEIISSVRIGLIDGNYIVNPTFEQIEKSQLNLFIVGSDKAITMVEGHAHEVSNQELVDALFFGHEYIKKINGFQREIVEANKKPTREWTPVTKDEEFINSIKEKAMDDVQEMARETDKSKRKELKNKLVDRLLEDVDPEDSLKTASVKEAVSDVLKAVVRENILAHNIRLDGRSNTDIRPIECELGLLPRAHGSSLFTRGQTQALASVTLGTKLDEQRVDSLDEMGFRRYMLHYNFPPYCTGEVKNRFGVTRREVGHGKLGERALEAVLPEWSDFPYTIRVVSDIMESNGSSSMASVCAGSLAMMDAGIPIKKAVAGIAMGLIKDGERYRFLTDILGDEDHLGDMDFKVTGTRDGITAFQMDIKIDGISAEMMAEALTQARDARHRILDIMDATINKPRSEISMYAPKFIIVKIPVDRIGALIGPGGKNIREIIADTGATIDVEDDGTVRIGATDGVAGENARKRVEALTEVPEAGKVYEGTIKRIMDFGAFVEIIPGVEGLMHISQIENFRIERVSDYFEVGDKVKVKLLKVEPDGKLDLSRKALLDEESLPPLKRNTSSHPRDNAGGRYQGKPRGRGPRR